MLRSNVCIWWGWIEALWFASACSFCTLEQNDELKIWDIPLLVLSPCPLRHLSFLPFPVPLLLFPPLPESWSGGPGMLLSENVKISALLSCVCIDLTPARIHLLQMRNEASLAFSNLLILIKHSLDFRHLNEPTSGTHRSDLQRVTNSHIRLSFLHGWITRYRPITLLHTPDSLKWSIVSQTQILGE